METDTQTLLDTLVDRSLNGQNEGALTYILARKLYERGNVNKPYDVKVGAFADMIRKLARVYFED